MTVPEDSQKITVSSAEQDFTVEVEPAHRVTVSDLYHKVEDLHDDVKILVERDRTDHEMIKELDKSVDWLKRAVYAAGIPLVLLIGGWELVSKVIL